jgi:hypothetical protein
MSRNFLTSLNLNKNELLNAAIQSLAVAPSSPVVGQIYFDTALNNLRTWDGTQWLEYLTAESGAGFITSVGDNLDVTDQELNLGANVVITDAVQTLTNKTINDELLFTNPSTDPDDGGIKINDSNENLEIKAYTAAVIIESTNDNVEIYANNGIATVNEDEIVTVTDTQTLTNKTIDTGTLKGRVSITDASDTETAYIEHSYTGTTRIVATDDLAIRSTGGDIILYPGNDDGGTGKAYVHWGNDATGAGAANEIATVGTSQTFSNKTVSDGITFNNGTDAPSAIYLGGADLVVESAGNLNLASDTADINLYADGSVYVGTSASGNEVATHSYVEGLVQGLNVKDSVIRMSDANIALESWNADGSFFDGVDTLQAGNRVLLTAQSTAAENGIYVIGNDGGLERVADQPTVDKGDYTLVVEGTYAATGWIATSATAWTQFSAANEYTAGNGIDISGNAISVKIDGNTLAETGSGLYVQLSEGGGLNVDAYGLYAQVGTGLTVNGSSGDIEIDTASGYGVRKYAEANGALTATSGSVSWAVTHGLGTRDVTVQLFDLATYEQVEVDVTRTSTSVVTLSWVSEDVSADAYRVVVVG